LLCQKFPFILPILSRFCHLFFVPDTTTASYLSLLRDSGVKGIPCEEDDIDKIEHELGIELPPAYKAFLLLAGQGFKPLEGSHYTVDDDLAQLQLAGQSVASDAKTSLPAGAFVFLVHQGFACLYFLLHDFDDPAVFECVEGLGPPRPISLRFSDWLLQQGKPSVKR
jgi:SMI1 / KNR4 family (SUKH-1)